MNEPGEPYTFSDGAIPCQVPGHQHVAACESSLGWQLPFCAPHVEALPRRLLERMTAVAGASIYETENHALAVELLEKGKAAIAKRIETWAKTANSAQCLALLLELLIMRDARNDGDTAYKRALPVLGIDPKRVAKLVIDDDGKAKKPKGSPAAASTAPAPKSKRKPKGQAAKKLAGKRKKAAA